MQRTLLSVFWKTDTRVWRYLSSAVCLELRFKSTVLGATGELILRPQQHPHLLCVSVFFVVLETEPRGSGRPGRCPSILKTPNNKAVHMPGSWQALNIIEQVLKITLKPKYKDIYNRRLSIHVKININTNRSSLDVTRKRLAIL